MDRPSGGATNGLPNGDGVSNGIANGGELQPPSGTLSATTITTVAVQAGKTKIVLAILKVSHRLQAAMLQCSGVVHCVQRVFGVPPARQVISPFLLPQEIRSWVRCAATKSTSPSVSTSWRVID
jgi:hypothetical protein